MNKNTPVDQLTFEQAMSELESIVRDLESGQAPLDDSITSYERGVQLRDYCKKKLDEAQGKIDKISFNPDGSSKLESMTVKE